MMFNSKTEVASNAEESISSPGRCVYGPPLRLLHYVACPCVRCVHLCCVPALRLMSLKLFFVLTLWQRRNPTHVLFLDTLSNGVRTTQQTRDILFVMQVFSSCIMYAVEWCKKDTASIQCPFPSFMHVT